MHRSFVAGWLVLATLFVSPAVAQLSFEFNFTDSNTGFNDPNEGAARRAALETAATKDAALLADLPPGTYTVQLSGADNGTGVGLIEVYDAD